MSEPCPFPRCGLSCWHDGDHDPNPSEPHGELRLVQLFATAYQRCEVCPEMPAKGLYMDARGKGWMLCVVCESEYEMKEEAA